MRTFAHNPQDYMVAANLATALREVPASAEAEPAMVGAGAESGARTGLLHAELADVLAEDVEVRGRQHFFCNSHSYRVLRTRAPGDGNRLDPQTRCAVDVAGVPADGWYNAELEITNNNGSIAARVTGWFDQQTGQRIPADLAIVGAKG